MMPPLCAIMVTFHPAAETHNNLRRILSLVSQVIVVDNGSFPEEIASCIPENCGSLHTIRNRENRGIAAAINQGVALARALGFEYVFLFDQDSFPPEDFATSMWEFYNLHPRKAALGLIVPRYWQESVHSFLPAVRSSDGCLELPMTSGSFCPIRTFDVCGGMREDLFIDMVDYDFAFRLRDAGLLVLECVNTQLEHCVASPVPFQLAGRTLFYASHYSADRRYYSTRNKLVLMRRYLRRYPRAMWILLRSEFADRLKMLLAERNRRAKLGAVFQGAWDALRGRMGPRA